MSQLQAFKSTGWASVALTTASACTSAPIGSDGENILIFNACSVPVACDFNTASFSATAASPFLVPPNTRLLVTVSRGFALYAAAYPIGTAAASVYFMRGDESVH